MYEPLMSIHDEIKQEKENSCKTDLKERILDAFAARAREVGVRAVSTDEMAKTLSISKKTLYKQYRSKEELVEAVLDRWAVPVTEPTVIEVGENPKEVALQAAATWYDNDATFCEQFWKDTGDDYPALKRKYYSIMYCRMKYISKQLTPFRKPYYSDEFLRETYFLLIIKASEPSFYEAAKLTRKESVSKSIEIWLDGAFNLPEIYNG